MYKVVYLGEYEEYITKTLEDVTGIEWGKHLIIFRNEANDVVFGVNTELVRTLEPVTN